MTTPNILYLDKPPSPSNILRSYQDVTNYSVPNFMIAFRLFATPKLALAMTCLTLLSNPPPFAVSCASDSLLVFETRSRSNGPPSVLRLAGRAFVDMATMDDAMAMTSDKCSLSAGV